MLFINFTNMRKVLACRFKRVKTAAIQVPGMIVLGRRRRKQNQLPNIFAYQIECTPLHTNLSGLISANSGGEIHHPLQANPDSFDAWFTITFTAKETAEAGDEAHHRV